MARKAVVGALIRRDGKILLAQRTCETLNGKWEFPGGKVESGETHQEALEREISEELSAKVVVQEKLASSDFSIGETRYCLHCYWADLVSGEPVANEHHNVKWVLPQEVSQYDLAPADIPIAKAIN